MKYLRDMASELYLNNAIVGKAKMKSGRQWLIQ